MIVDEKHVIFSLKQSRWLENYRSLNTQKRNQATNNFGKDTQKLGNSAFYGETMENLGKKLKTKFIRKDVDEETNKK